MLRIRVRACIKCRESAIFYPNYPGNQNLIRVYEINHKEYTLITLDIDEVKDQNKNFKGQEL
ncbi:MAG: hypothetical protein KGD61_05360 [Candidatus Lokiarchaeota archaeon]|nr:hypothetical protein [Candidatus Lokiarchaeota archaeon]